MTQGAKKGQQEVRKEKRPTIPTEEYVTKGHMACQGCGAVLAMRYLLKALGPRTIISTPACCWSVIHGQFPYWCLKVPVMHTAFEATGASISGIAAALEMRGVENVNVVGFAGDGGTADIGIQSLSAAVERGEPIIYCCYDNEAYMNTGIQRSGSTPYGAWTTTTPGESWKKRPKKNMVEIMVAHEIPYAATACVAYPEDMIKKAIKAKENKPAYLHVLAPCPTGWRYPPAEGIRIGRMAVQSRTFPLYEVDHGAYRITARPRTIPVKNYLESQGRFKHLTSDAMDYIQQQVDRRWAQLEGKAGSKLK